ncbi:MAG: hypothetical protein KA716_26210 [Gloeotrichia echinulata DEX184]|nr:hypothetical protein [Gloeotrichia echinulata DEX184]
MRQGLTVPGGSVRTAKIYQYLVIFIPYDIVGARYELPYPTLPYPIAPADNLFFGGDCCRPHSFPNPQSPEKINLGQLRVETY